MKIYYKSLLLAISKGNYYVKKSSLIKKKYSLELKSNFKFLLIKIIFFLSYLLKKKNFYLKKKKTLITLLRSPHVNKKSREQFFYFRYSTTLDLDFIQKNFVPLLWSLKKSIQSISFLIVRELKIIN